MIGRKWKQTAVKIDSDLGEITFLAFCFWHKVNKNIEYPKYMACTPHKITPSKKGKQILDRSKALNTEKKSMYSNLIFAFIWRQNVLDWCTGKKTYFV